MSFKCKNKEKKNIFPLVSLSFHLIVDFKIKIFEKDQACATA